MSDFSKIYSFLAGLNKNGETWQDVADEKHGNDDGIVNRGEFFKLINSDFTGWNGETKQEKTDLINKFWGNFDTDSTGCIGNSGVLDDGALNNKEIDNLNKRLEKYIVFEEFIQANVDNDCPDSLTAQGRSDYQKEVRKLLSQEFEAFLNSDPNASSEEIKVFLTNAIKAIEENALTKCLRLDIERLVTKEANLNSEVKEAIAGYPPEYREQVKAAISDAVSKISEEFSDEELNEFKSTWTGENFDGAKFLKYLDLIALDALVLQKAQEDAIQYCNENVKKGGEYAKAVEEVFGLDHETTIKAMTIDELKTKMQALKDKIAAIAPSGGTGGTGGTEEPSDPENPDSEIPGNKPVTDVNRADISNENRYGEITSGWVSGKDNTTLETAKAKALEEAKKAIDAIATELITKGYPENKVNTAKGQLVEFLVTYMSNIIDVTVNRDLINSVIGDDEYAYRQHSGVKGFPKFKEGTTLIQLLEQTTLGRAYQIVIDKAMLTDKFIEFLQKVTDETVENKPITDSKSGKDAKIEDINFENRTGTVDSGDWTDGRKDTLEGAKSEAIKNTTAKINSMAEDLIAAGYKTNEVNAAKTKLINHMTNYIGSITDTKGAGTITKTIENTNNPDYNFRHEQDIHGLAEFDPNSTMVQLLEQTTGDIGYKIVVDLGQLADKFIDFLKNITTEEVTSEEEKSTGKNNNPTLADISNDNKTGTIDSGDWTDGRNNTLSKAKAKAIENVTAAIKSIKADLLASGCDSSALDDTETEMIKYMTCYIDSIKDNKGSQVWSWTFNEGTDYEFRHEQDISGLAKFDSTSTMVQLLEQTTGKIGYKIVIDKTQLANKFIEKYKEQQG